MQLLTAVRAASGSVLHGLDGIPGPVEVPENTVVHQVPVSTPEGRRGVVIRVYGVEDDPKASVASWNATWFGRPMLEELRSLGMDLGRVWPGLPAHEWTLWNAHLFPVATVEEAWACAQWLLRVSGDYSIERWSAQERLSLASSAQWADGAALEAAHSRRLKAHWRTLALSLAAAGADVRPLLAHAPGIGPLAETGNALRSQATELETSAPTEAASRHYAAGLFFGQAGLAQEARESARGSFPARRARGKGGQLCARTVPHRALAACRSDRRRSRPHRSGGRLVRHTAVLSRLGRHRPQYRRPAQWLLSHPDDDPAAQRTDRAL